MRKSLLNHCNGVGHAFAAVCNLLASRQLRILGCEMMRQATKHYSANTFNGKYIFLRRNYYSERNLYEYTSLCNSVAKVKVQLYEIKTFLLVFILKCASYFR